MSDVFALDGFNTTGSTNNTRVDLVWSQQFQNDDVIQFSSTKDGGKTFTSPVNVSNYNNVFGLPSAPEIFSIGERVGIASETDKAGNSKIIFSSSNDGGKTFSRPVGLSNNANDSSDPVITTNGDNIYVAWRGDHMRKDTKDNASLNSGIYFALSSDGGETFSVPVKVSNNLNDSISPVCHIFQ